MENKLKCLRCGVQKELHIYMDSLCLCTRCLYEGAALGTHIFELLGQFFTSRQNNLVSEGADLHGK